MQQLPEAAVIAVAVAYVVVQFLIARMQHNDYLHVVVLPLLPITIVLQQKRIEPPTKEAIQIQIQLFSTLVQLVVAVIALTEQAAVVALMVVAALMVDQHAVALQVEAVACVAVVVVAVVDKWSSKF